MEKKNITRAKEDQALSIVPVMRAKENLQEVGTERGKKDVIRIEVGAETRKGTEKKIVIAATAIEARGVGLEVEMMILLMMVPRAGNTGRKIMIEIGMRDTNIGQNLMRESGRKGTDTGRDHTTRIERKGIGTGPNPMTKIERIGTDVDLAQGEHLVIGQDRILDLGLVHAPKAKGSVGLTWHLLLLLCYLVLLRLQCGKFLPKCMVSFCMSYLMWASSPTVLTMGVSQPL